MPRKKHNEVIAGLFVLLAVATLLGVVFWLGAVHLLETKGQMVSFYVPQDQGSTGLELGADVTVGDGSIGRLVDIQPDPAKQRCLYHAQLNRKDITITADGKAQIVSAPIGLSKLVIISSGTPGQPLADDKHPILLSGGLDRAMAHIADSAENLKVITLAIRKQVSADDGGKLLSDVGGVVGDLKTASANIVAISGNLRNMMDPKIVDSALAKVNKAIDDIGQITSQAKPKIEQMLTSGANLAGRLDDYARKDIADILARLRESNTKIFEMSQDLSEASRQAKEMVAMNRDSVDVMVGNMALVSSNLKAMAAEVRRAPWRLMYKPTDKETREQDIHDAARAFSDAAAQMDQTAAKLAGLIKASPSGLDAQNPAIRQMLKELQDRFNQLGKFEQALWEELQKK